MLPNHTAGCAPMAPYSTLMIFSTYAGRRGLEQQAFACSFGLPHAISPHPLQQPYSVSDTAATVTALLLHQCCLLPSCCCWSPSWAAWHACSITLTAVGVLGASNHGSPPCTHHSLLNPHVHGSCGGYWQCFFEYFAVQKAAWKQHKPACSALAAAADAADASAATDC